MEVCLDQGLAQAFNAGASAFDDMFVHQRVEGHGIVAVVTGHAKRAGGKAGGLDHACLRKVGERVGVEIFADFVQRVVCRHQLAAVWKIDAIDAGIHVGRATDQDVDLLSARFLEVVHAGFAGGAAHD